MKRVEGSFINETFSSRDMARPWQLQDARPHEDLPGLNDDLIVYQEYQHDHLFCRRFDRSPWPGSDT
jgi:hypothetical protein